MAEGGEAAAALQQPLLTNEEGESWSDVEDVEQQQASDYCSMPELFKQHPHDAVRYLQKKGVARLGEFTAPENLVFAAFSKDALLTLGSDRRHLDYQRAWRTALEERVGRSGGKQGLSREAGVSVEAFVVTVRGAAGPDCQGLLQPLLKRWQAGRYGHTVFGLPAVQAVINWKWHAFARTMLLWELAFFLLWLLAFNVFTILFQDEDLSFTLPQLLATTRGKFTVACELLALVGMAPFLLLEGGTLAAYGWGWLDGWNILDFSTYAVQVAITAMHLGRLHLRGDTLSVLPAVQLILLTFRLQYFLRVFSSTRFDFVDTVRSVIRDMRWMFLFVILVTWAFGSAFHIVFRRDQDGESDFDTILHAFASTFEHQSGGLELKRMYSSKSPIAATSLALAYTFVMGMVLVNLLVGIVVNSLEKATEDADTKLLLGQARVIDELEATIPSWIERRNPHWYPAFVHALRINADKLDKVEHSGLWAQAGDANGGDGGDAGGDQAVSSAAAPTANDADGVAASAAIGQDGRGVQELRASVEEMRRQLEAQAAMLGALCRQLGVAEPPK